MTYLPLLLQQQTKKAISPTDTLLVVDAMTGQEAAALVKSFNDAVDITGAVLGALTWQ